MKKALTVNDAIVQGAIESGVNIVTGYPGAPVSGIIGEIQKKLLKKMFI